MNQFEYTVGKDGVTITRFAGNASCAVVPGFIDGTEVTAIGKKAFLSKKFLRKLILPDSVREIGDWAFAYCDGLESVTLPSGRVKFGKSVFLECGSLKRIEIEGKEDHVAPLLAAAVNTGAYYLLDTIEAGSDEWIVKWDSRMLSVLNASNQEGYSKQVLCGEEDYGSTDLEAYKSGSRKKKLRMALLRLLYSKGLSRENEDRLKSYVISHTKGCASEESWEIILNEHGNDREYYELFASLGCVSADNIAGILADIGEDLPEMKAFFISCNDEKRAETNFFDDLEL